MDITRLYTFASCQGQGGRGAAQVDRISWLEVRLTLFKIAPELFPL